jgi:hypothetical protein
VSIFLNGLLFATTGGFGNSLLLFACRGKNAIPVTRQDMQLTALKLLRWA